MATWWLKTSIGKTRKPRPFKRKGRKCRVKIWTLRIANTKICSRVFLAAGMSSRSQFKWIETRREQNTARVPTGRTKRLRKLWTTASVSATPSSPNSENSTPTSSSKLTTLNTFHSLRLRLKRYWVKPKFQRKRSLMGGNRVTICTWKRINPKLTTGIRSAHRLPIRCAKVRRPKLAWSRGTWSFWSSRC